MVLPWLVSWVVYESSAFGTLVDYSGLLVVAPLALVVPFVVYLAMQKPGAVRKIWVPDLRSPDLLARATSDVARASSSAHGVPTTELTQAAGRGRRCMRL